MADDVRVLGMDGLQQLVDVLGARGYSVVGPTVRDGAIVPGAIRTVDDLPRGWGDEQDAAHYRLRRRDDDALFGFAAGAQSPKPVFFPATELFWRGRRTGEEFTVNQEGPEADGDGIGPYALLGVRSCAVSYTHLTLPTNREV